MPASIICSRTVELSDAGPMVQMIFVLWKGKDVKKDSLARVGQSNRMKIFSFP